MATDATVDRTVVNYRDAPFETYHLQGEPQDDVQWCNISWEDETGDGFFLIRFSPGAVSIPHEHLGYEEFVLLEGDLTDQDGWRYKPGDCVSLPSGSRHYTKSEEGATVAVFIRGGFRTLPEGTI